MSAKRVFFHQVNWKPPRKELQYGVVRGYYVGYRVVSTADSLVQMDNYVYKTIEVKGRDSIEECTITDLKRASRYEVIVQVFNSKGAGPTSEPYYVVTLEVDPPSAPSLQVSEVTFNYVRLTWITLADQIVSGLPNKGRARNQRKQTNLSLCRVHSPFQTRGERVGRVAFGRFEQFHAREFALWYTVPVLLGRSQFGWQGRSQSSGLRTYGRHM